jgi:hypothetical protein
LTAAVPHAEPCAMSVLRDIGSAVLPERAPYAERKNVGQWSSNEIIVHGIELVVGDCAGSYGEILAC